MSDTIYTNHPMASPTHYCKDCGALWRQNDDFTMSLRWANACESCNNTPVGGQLFPLTEIPLPTLPPVSVRPDVMDCTVMLHEKDAEIERLRRIEKAAQALADEAQEYAMDFGLGCAAPNSYWEDLFGALDPDEAKE